MYPDLYLFVEGVRGRELREAAACRRQARPLASASVVDVFEERLGRALVRAGLRLLDRRACQPDWSPFVPHR